jgi:hypothetical protein
MAPSAHSKVASLSRSFILVLLFLHAVRIWILGSFDISALGDFAVLWSASIAYQSGLNPYEPVILHEIAKAHGIIVYYGPFNYPPSLLMLVAPLTSFNYDQARYLWVMILFISLMCSLLALLIAVPQMNSRAYCRTLIVLGFLAYYPVPWNVIFGNFNIIILLLITLGVTIQSKAVWLASLPLGLGLATKIIPTVFMVIADVTDGAWRRASRVVVWSALVTVLAAIVTGPRLTLSYVLDRGPRFLTGDYANEINYPFNQALGGGFGRLFREGGNITPWLVAPALAQALHLAAAIFLIGFTFWVSRRATSDGRSEILPLIAILFAFILPTYSHAYYAIWLLPCYAAAVIHLLQSQCRRVGLMAFILSLSYILTGFVYNYDQYDFHNGLLLPLTSLPLVGTILLWVVLANLLSETSATTRVTHGT